MDHRRTDNVIICVSLNPENQKTHILCSYSISKKLTFSNSSSRYFLFANDEQINSYCQITFFCFVTELLSYLKVHGGGEKIVVIIRLHLSNTNHSLSVTMKARN
jgi:hypothetical protein